MKNHETFMERNFPKAYYSRIMPNDSLAGEIYAPYKISNIV